MSLRLILQYLKNFEATEFYHLFLESLFRTVTVSFPSISAVLTER